MRSVSIIGVGFDNCFTPKSSSEIRSPTHLYAENYSNYNMQISKFRLIRATQKLPNDASSREIATAAGYKSHKIINIYFESLEQLKTQAGTLESNKDEVNQVFPQIEFSLQDISRGIQIPLDITPLLAEEIGWHIGDGCIPNNKNGNAIYQLGGDPNEEREFYENYIKKTFKALYNYNAKPNFLAKGNLFGITFASKAIFDFKTKILGFPIGKKSHIIRIPDAIMFGDDENKKAVIRGIADTDFSVTFQKKHKNFHYYPAIIGSTVSKTLATQLKSLLIQLGFKPKVQVYFRKRTQHNEYLIRLMGKNQLEKWFDIIGSNNPKHITKYNVWAKVGFCPPYTKIVQRQKIIEGHLNPKKFYGG
ncbi:MAG: LAGLIDADG family homing endonuclease [Candidatus Diapherotrites archaeon]